MEQMLVAVGLDPRKASCRPAQLSGGQQQRVVLARALIAKPDVLVCDEPTSALDVSMQALVVNTLLRLQAEFGFACLLVTHDLGVSRVLADEILVLRNGRVEELTPADEFFDSPRSEYARLLLKLAGRLRAAPGNSNEPC
jgi:peptide/nickel transport system ATP-binding protein